MYFFGDINDIDIRGTAIFNGETFSLENLIEDLKAFEKEHKGEYAGYGVITGEELCNLLLHVNREE